MPNAVRYSPDVETIEPDEAETQQKLIETFRGIVETTNRDFGHAFRGVHAKSHALLEGTLTVNSDLPAEFAQGLFAQPKSYPILLRISTTPGDPLPDSISVPRGMAIKVIGVEGERLPGSESDTTQDFVLANGAVFSAANPKKFLVNLKLLAATTDKAEGGKKMISAFFRATEKTIEAFGGESATVESMGGYPNSHPLGERYFSQLPMRYGDYIAKLAVIPLSPNFKALEGTEIDIDGRDDALRQDLADALGDQGGEWEVRVQLCRDLQADPIEDGSVAWPEDDNPYVAVATIRVDAQPSWSFDRAKVLDDQTAFSPWHGLAAHRPLGGLMRARKPAYEQMSGLRARLNGCPINEPRASEPLPA